MIDIRWQLVAYVFVSIILWMVAAQLSRRRTSISWTRLLSEGWAASIVRFAYYIGLPYAALILGVVPGRYLGLVGLDRLQAKGSPLTGFASASDAWQLLFQLRDDVSLVILDWLPDVGRLASLAVAMLLLLSATWLGYGRFRYHLTAGLGLSLTSTPKTQDVSGIHVVYQAVHWSFYRSAVWLLTDDLYLGVVGGVLLVAGEWVLEPGWIDREQHTLSREVLLIDAGVLTATSVIFLFVPNLWLLLPIHWLLAIASRQMVSFGQRWTVGSQQH